MDNKNTTANTEETTSLVIMQPVTDEQVASAITDNTSAGAKRTSKPLKGIDEAIQWKVGVDDADNPTVLYYEYEVPFISDAEEALYTEEAYKAIQSLQRDINKTIVRKYRLDAPELIRRTIYSGSFNNTTIIKPGVKTRYKGSYHVELGKEVGPIKMNKLPEIPTFRAIAEDINKVIREAFFYNLPQLVIQSHAK